MLTYTTAPLAATARGDRPGAGRALRARELAVLRPVRAGLRRRPRGRAHGTSATRCARVAPGRFEADRRRHSRVAFELWPMGHRFAAGHRIRLQVSSGAHPRYARNPGTGEELAHRDRAAAGRRRGAARRGASVGARAPRRGRLASWCASHARPRVTQASWRRVRYRACWDSGPCRAARRPSPRPKISSRLSSDLVWPQTNAVRPPAEERAVMERRMRPCIGSFRISACKLNEASCRQDRTQRGPHPILNTYDLQGKPRSGPAPSGLRRILQAGRHRFDPGWLHAKNACSSAAFEPPAAENRSPMAHAPRPRRR